MKKSLLYLTYLLCVLLFSRCKHESTTVSFPTNIFVTIANEKNELLDSATICLFSDFDAYNEALAAYDISKSVQSVVSKNGKAAFENVEAGKQYWIFSFKKVEKTAFKNADKIADNYAVSDVFSITPKKGSESNIEIKIIPNSGVVVFSFLGQNLGIGLDKNYSIKINNKEVGPFYSFTNGGTNFYPISVRKNIPFSYLIQSKNGLCAWIERDVKITEEITYITLKPCELVRVGFVHIYKTFSTNGNPEIPIFSTITISGVDKGNIVGLEISNQVNPNPSICSPQITKTILLNSGVYDFAVTYTLGGVTKAIINEFTVAASNQTCLQTSTGLNFQPIQLR